MGKPMWRVHKLKKRSSSFGVYGEEPSALKRWYTSHDMSKFDGFHACSIMGGPPWNLIAIIILKGAYLALKAA